MTEGKRASGKGNSKNIYLYVESIFGSYFFLRLKCNIGAATAGGVPGIATQRAGTWRVDESSIIIIIAIIVGALPYLFISPLHLYRYLSHSFLKPM